MFARAQVLQPTSGGALASAARPPAPTLPNHFPCVSALPPAENEQLEELLSRADAQAAGGSGQISRLEDELARAQVGCRPACSHSND